MIAAQCKALEDLAMFQANKLLWRMTRRVGACRVGPRVSLVVTNQCTGTTSSRRGLIQLDFSCASAPSKHVRSVWFLFRPRPSWRAAGRQVTSRTFITARD